MDNLNTLRSYRDRIQKEYLDACCDMRYTVEKFNELWERLIDLNEQIESMENGDMTERYNGYHNYETWLVKVWIDNDQGNVEYWVEQAQDLYTNHAEDTKYFTKREEAIILLSESMKEYYEDRMPEGDDIGGLWSDLLHSALSDVDWHELAGMIMEQALENFETV